LNVANYAFFLYSVSYFLLLFNMLPIYPLDGGQFLQGVLWKAMGYYRATLIATSFGMVGGILMALYGFTTPFPFFLLFIGIGVCFLSSLRVQRAIKEVGPHAFEDADNTGWRRSLNIDPDEPEKKSWKQKRLERKAQAQREREAAMRQRVEERLDFLLAKISDTGIDSLTAAERKELDQAREAKAALGDG
ncbi:MAG: site-2 protease family protein, partial [Planctomycetota bacterium]